MDLAGLYAQLAVSERRLLGVTAIYVGHVFSYNKILTIAIANTPIMKLRIFNAFRFSPSKGKAAKKEANGRTAPQARSALSVLGDIGPVISILLISGYRTLQ